MYVCVYVCMHACMHACMDGWMDGWMDVFISACICTRNYFGYASFLHTSEHIFTRRERERERENREGNTSTGAETVKSVRPEHLASPVFMGFGGARSPKL